MKLLSFFFVGVVVAINPVPTVQLAPGVNMPLVGIGTWQYNDTKAGATVASALEIGYTAIDTAFGYNNAIGVGNAVKNYMAKTGTARSKLWITSKVMTGIPGAGNLSMYDLAVQHIKDLQLDYVDLMLLHFPCAPSASGCGGGTKLRQDQWRSIEGLIASKKARSIGVSHYCARQLQDIFEIMTVKPALNQVQYHVGMGHASDNATDYKEFNQKHGVTYGSFSPLCGPCGTKELINGPLVTGIGAKYNKTGAQISLKWQVQQGIPVIPKTSNPIHQRENIELFDFQLSEDEMTRLTVATSPAVGGGPGPQDSGDCGIP